MKVSIKKITALTLVVLTLGASVSCGEEKPEDMSDSQESQNEENQQPEKTVIDIAYLTYQNKAWEGHLKSFTKDGQYEVNVTYYWDEAANLNTSDDVNFDIEAEAAELLHLDMVSGKVPDIIISESEYMLPLIRQDYFTDLYPLMDAGEITRDKFLPNFLKGFEIDGELPVFTAGVHIETAAAKSEVVGKEMEHWTLDEMRTVCEDITEDARILQHKGTVYELPHYVNHQFIRECIDMENASCDFHGVFLEAADFISEKNINDNNKVDADFAISDGRALITTVDLNGINQSMTWQLYEDFDGADITFVGYPSSDGCGAVVSEQQQMFGILENSDCKDAAWKFLCGMLSEGYQVKNTVGMQGLPVLESAVDAAMEYTQWDSSSINSVIKWDENGEPITQIDEKTKQTIEDYIRSIEIRPYFDHKLESIVKEEYASVALGEKTAEDAADIIENRIRLYINESF